MKNKQPRKTKLKADRAKNGADRAESKSSSNAQPAAKAAKAVKSLTKAEKRELQQLESTISSGLSSYVEVGRALSSLSVTQLYREEYSTFDEYCERRWDISGTHGYRLIKAAQCHDWLKLKLPKGALLPRNESQLRPLVENLEPGKWVQAWQRVIADTQGVRLTADSVEKVVRTLGGSSSRPKHVDRKKAQSNKPTQTVAKIVEVADEALRMRKASVADLRKALEIIRYKLKRLSERTDS